MLVDCSHGCTNVSGYIVCNEGCVLTHRSPNFFVHWRFTSCNGGWHWAALQDIIDWGGIALRKDYPYTGHDGKCRLDTNPPALYAPIKNYTCLSGPELADEKYMASYLVQNGPLSIALDASPLQLYFGGIIGKSLYSNLLSAKLYFDAIIPFRSHDSFSHLLSDRAQPCSPHHWLWSWEGYYRLHRLLGYVKLCNASVYSILIPATFLQLSRILGELLGVKRATSAFAVEPTSVVWLLLFYLLNCKQ